MTAPQRRKKIPRDAYFSTERLWKMMTSWPVLNIFHRQCGIQFCINGGCTHLMTSYKHCFMWNPRKKRRVANYLHHRDICDGPQLRLNVRFHNMFTCQWHMRCRKKPLPTSIYLQHLDGLSEVPTRRIHCHDFDTVAMNDIDLNSGRFVKNRFAYIFRAVSAETTNFT